MFENRTTAMNHKVGILKSSKYLTMFENNTTALKSSSKPYKCLFITIVWF